MRTTIRKTTMAALVPLSTLALVTACASHPPRTVTVPAASAPATTTVVIPSASANPQRVTYAEGSYELRGDGSAANPYYWVWIPRGVVIQTIPPPPPLPPR